MHRRALKFPAAPILLGYVLGPMVEENFRRALLLSRGDLMVFVQHPISAVFVATSALLIGVQIWIALRTAHSRHQARIQKGNATGSRNWLMQRWPF